MQTAVQDQGWRNQKGYTIVELTAVLFILVLIAGLATPKIVTLLRNTRLEQAARVLVADIRLAQEMAQRGGGDTRVLIYPTSYEVQVAAPGVTAGCSMTQYYTLTVVRGDVLPGQELGVPPAASTTTGGLRELSVSKTDASALALDPPFSTGIMNYTVRVGHQVKSVVLTTRKERPNALTRLLGEQIAGGAKQIFDGGQVTLDLRQGINTFTIQVDEGNAQQGYRVHKRVDLTNEFQIKLSNQSMTCLPFNAMGRPGWQNPVVLDERHSTMHDGGVSRVYYTNGLEEVKGRQVSSSAADQTYRWQRTVKTDVLLVVDLGQSRFLSWTCAQVIEDKTSTNTRMHFPFPAAIQLEMAVHPDGSPFTEGFEDQNPDWKPNWKLITAQPLRPPYSTTDVGRWRRACEKIPVNRTLRYIRFVITPESAGVWGTALAIDEIKFMLPVVTLESEGSDGVRHIMISPTTGKVSIQQ